MAKNTSSSAFRQLKVSAYSDEEEEEEPQMDGEVPGPSEGEVQGLLNSGKNGEALRLVLSNPPVNTKNQAVKDRTLQTVMKVLLSFKGNEIDGAIKSMDQATQDVLMKYIFRGFEFPSEGSSAQLLTWHEKVFATAGLGCIVRVLTDRKRV